MARKSEVAMLAGMTTSRIVPMVPSGQLSGSIIPKNPVRVSLFYGSIPSYRHTEKLTDTQGLNLITTEI